MSNASIIGYATIMDGNNAGKLGTEPERIYIHGFQKFFGFPDASLVGETLEDVLDERGELLPEHLQIGATTVEKSSDHMFNAVIYRNVPESILAELDQEEAKAHLRRVAIPSDHIINYEDGRPWQTDGNAVCMYVVEPQVTVPGIGTVSLIKDNVQPHPTYLQRCREAAHSQGDDFLAAFNLTTYLSDRRTTLDQSEF